MIDDLVVVVSSWITPLNPLNFAELSLDPKGDRFSFVGNNNRNVTVGFIYIFPA